MLDQVLVTANDELLGALRRLGRTEDVTFSADGSRLAIAGFGEDSIVVLDVTIEDKPGSPVVAVGGLTEVWSPALRSPHGLAFLGERALVVANRAGEAPVFDLPPPSVGIRRVNVEPTAIIGPGTGAELVSPGSVRAAALAADLYEVFVCDNTANVVTRYVVDVRDGVSVLSGEVLAAHSLATPDSVALSRDRGWLAVSNHDTHSVLLFRGPSEMHAGRWADGVLENVTYPHGVAFTADGNHVVVADAGAPFLHVYARGDGDWSGGRQPVRSVRVMSDETFLRGRYNIQEGGPKGLDIDDASELVVVSSEHQTLALFELADVLGPDAERRPAPRDDAEHVRGAVMRELRAAASARDAVVVSQAAADAGAARVSELAATASALEGRCADLTALAREATATADRAAGELADAHEQARQAAESAARTAAELRDAVADREVAVAHLAHLQTVVADRDAQLAALRSSTSWRITAPLRWMAGHRRRR